VRLTRYRSLFAGSEERFNFEIPAARLTPRGRLLILLALDDLPAYRKSGSTRITGAVVHVRKGDTLAVASDASFMREEDRSA